MKKTLTLVMLATMVATSSLFAQEKNIKVIDRVAPSIESFSNALGSDRYTIDSLVVTYGYFYPEFSPCLKIVVRKVA